MSRCWRGTVCRAPAPCFQVRLSILLDLRCSSFILLCRFERAGGGSKVPAPGRPPKGYTFTPIRPKLPGARPGQPPTIIPPSSRHARPRPTFEPPPGFRPIRPIRRPGQPQTIMRPQLDPPERLPGSPPHQPPTPPLVVTRPIEVLPSTPEPPRILLHSNSPTPPMSPYTPPSAPLSEEDYGSLPQTPLPPTRTGTAPRIVAPPSPLGPSVPWSESVVERPPSRDPEERELLEHIDQRIKLAARAAVRELLKASMDDLD
jgi:hypothetical protein